MRCVLFARSQCQTDVPVKRFASPSICTWHLSGRRRHVSRFFATARELASRPREYERMKVLLNTTTLAIGGACNWPTSLILEALATRSTSIGGSHYRRAYTIRYGGFHPDAIPHAEVFDETPAKSRGARRRLEALEAEIEPDGVFTPYGPAYVQFAAPHLMARPILG